MTIECAASCSFTIHPTAASALGQQAVLVEFATGRTHMLQVAQTDLCRELLALTILEVGKHLLITLTRIGIAAPMQLIRYGVPACNEAPHSLNSSVDPTGARIPACSGCRHQLEL